MRRAADAEVLAVLHRHNASPYSAVGNGQLLDRVPEPLRLVHYTRRAIPAEYAASFGYYHRKIGDVHLDGLPEPMQRELMFVVWRIVELGGCSGPAGAAQAPGRAAGRSRPRSTATRCAGAAPPGPRHQPLCASPISQLEATADQSATARSSSSSVTQA